MAAEMMSGDLPVTSDADAMAKQKAKEDALAGGGTMLASGSTKRKADQVNASAREREGGGGRTRVLLQWCCWCRSRVNAL